MDKVSNAVELMKGAHSCSQSVLCAFCEDAGLTFEDAEKIAAPYSGGRKIKCGAVCAAEIVLQNKFGAAAEEKISEFEQKFQSKVGALNCKDIRRNNLRPCIGCVEDSATILSTMLAN